MVVGKDRDDPQEQPLATREQNTYGFLALAGPQNKYGPRPPKFIGAKVQKTHGGQKLGVSHRDPEWVIWHLTVFTNSAK